MGVTKFVARDDASASKPAETRVCRTSRQSRHHHEVSIRPCSILARSPGARCHAHRRAVRTIECANVLRTLEYIAISYICDKMLRNVYA